MFQMSCLNLKQLVKLNDSCLLDVKIWISKYRFVFLMAQEQMKNFVTALSNFYLLTLEVINFLHCAAISLQH